MWIHYTHKTRCLQILILNIFKDDYTSQKWKGAPIKQIKCIGDANINSEMLLLLVNIYLITINRHYVIKGWYFIY